MLLYVTAVNAIEAIYIGKVNWYIGFGILLKRTVARKHKYKHQ